MKADVKTMKKKLPAAVVIALIIIACIIICCCVVCFAIYLYSAVIEPKIPTDTAETKITTYYGDNIILRNEKKWRGLKPYTTFYVLYDEDVLFTETREDSYYYAYYDAKDWDAIINSYKEDSVRIYELGWGMIYSTDNGNSFKGVRKSRYTDYYITDEEFAQIYEMLYAKPFYDERFAEHLARNKKELPDGKTAEYIESESRKSKMGISEVEALAGKAQRCICARTEMRDGGEEVREIVLEYDLSDGRILAVAYDNMSEIGEMDFYVSSSEVRDLYVPEESGGAAGSCAA